MAGAGAIIPFASNGTVALTTVLAGVIGNQAAVSFSGRGTVVTSGGVITLSANDLAFSVPRTGFLSSLAAYFTTSLAATLTGSTATITAQVYSSTAPSNVFSPIPGAVVILAPALTGTVGVGAITSGVSPLPSIPAAAGTRLMMVFTASVTAGTDVATTITGFASGGLGIS